MRELSTIAVIAGLALVAVSWIWPSLAGGRQNWTEEQAESYAQAAASLHTLNYQAAQAKAQATRRGFTSNPQAALAEQRLASAAQTGATVNPATATADRLQAELAAAQVRYQRERAQLGDARSHGQNAATLMRWLGAGLFAAGLIGAFVRQSKDAH